MFAGELVAALLDEGKCTQVVSSLVVSGSCLQPPLAPLAGRVYSAAKLYVQHHTHLKKIKLYMRIAQHNLCLLGLNC